jgi:hypothetical protein
MASRVDIDGTTRGLSRELAKLQKELDKLKAQGFQANTKASQDLERAGKKAFESTRTAAEKYTATQKQLLAAVKAGKISLDTYNRAVSQAAGELKDAERSSNKFGESITQQAFAMGAGFATVSQAVNLVRESFQAWLEDTREMAQRADDITDAAVTFAALQTPGTAGQRLQETIGRAQGELGAADALDLQQSLQSAAGTYEKGAAIFDEVIQAAKTGLPAEVGGEAAIQAFAAGEDPIQALRLLIAGGQASGRSAEVVGLAAPALADFPDKLFGTVVAAQLTGQFNRKVDVFTSRAGKALGNLSGLSDKFKELGVGEGATREERLRALAAAGIDTKEELQEAGLTEDREIRALSNLVKSVISGSFDAIKDSTIDLLSRGDELVPGLQQQVEADLPFLPGIRASRQNIGEFERLRSTDIEAVEARRIETERALELQRGGRTTGLFGRNVDDEGNVRLRSYLNDLLVGISEILGGDLIAVRANTQRMAESATRPAVPQPEAGAQ